MSASALVPRRLLQLKKELQSELNRPAASRSDHGVCRRDVRRDAAATERLGGWIVKTESVLTAVRVREVRMIENIEELGAELRIQPLAEFPILHD